MKKYFAKRNSWKEKETKPGTIFIHIPKNIEAPGFVQI